MHWQPSEQFSNGDVPAAPGTRVAILCDDGLAAGRAIRVIAELGTAWGFRLDPIFWRMDELSAHNRAWAEADIIDADYVLVSLSHPRAAAAAVGQWVGPCLDAKRRPCETAIRVGGTRGWTIRFLDRRGILTSRTDLARLLASRRPAPHVRRRHHPSGGRDQPG